MFAYFNLEICCQMGNIVEWQNENNGCFLDNNSLTFMSAYNF